MEATVQVMVLVVVAVMRAVAVEAAAVLPDVFGRYIDPLGSIAIFLVCSCVHMHTYGHMLTCGRAWTGILC